jgi:hypothetical protein
MHGTLASIERQTLAEHARSDEALLSALLRRLHTQGVVEFSGEFGNEIATFLPLANWLKREGHLDGKRVRTYRGMKPFYFFLDDDQIEFKDEPRDFFKHKVRDWPSHSTHTAKRRYWHAPPDFRAHYAPRARRFEKPTLFVQNKFTVEWDHGPVNFIPIGDLRRLLELTTDRFQIVFSRPGAVSMGPGYSPDANAFAHYPDLEIVRRFPGALVLEEMVQAEGRPYNEVKLEVLAGAHAFYTVQGGSAHILAAFGDALLAIIHRRGAEYPHAYAHGPYKFLAPRPPEILVARSDKDVRAITKMFADISVANDHVRIGKKHDLTRWRLRK